MVHPHLTKYPWSILQPASRLVLLCIERFEKFSFCWLQVFNGSVKMQGEEKPEADPSDDVDDEDDDINDDNVKSIQLSTEAVRSKSEQDLARTHSLDLLTVGY